MDNREFATIAKFSSLEEAQRLIVNRSDLPRAEQILKAKFDKSGFKSGWQV